MHERDHSHAVATRSAAQIDADVATNRDRHSSALDAPARPIASGLLMRKERDDNGVAAHADAAVATAAGSSGSTLPENLMRKFEGSLGTDLSSVRVHTGAESNAAAHAVGARAYTMGQDIHFGAGQYDPASASGEHLLAHEVAHTVQQQGGTPSRQNKLEVSTPADSLEHEADRAADAMVTGVPAAVTTSSGVARQAIMRDAFGPPPPPGWNSPLKGGASKSGIPYDVPTIDYRSSVVAAAPSMDTEMPVAAFKDPGPIPGWKAIQPAQSWGFGPFQGTSPAREVLIAGEEHSQEIKDAWFYYKNELLTAVASTWDSGARMKMNTYAQQKNSDPELDAIVKDMRDTYRMANVGQQGKGTVSAQAGQTNVSGGSNSSTIAGHIKNKGGDFTTDLAATAKTGQDGTVGGPVGRVVDEIKAERLKTVGNMATLQGLQSNIEGAKDKLSAATLGIEIEDLNEKVDDEKKKKEEIANGQASLKKYAPEIAGIVKLVQDNADKLKTISSMVKAAPGAMEGDPSAILEVGKGVLEIAKWDALAKADQNISSLTDQIARKYKLKNAAELRGAVSSLNGFVRQAQGVALALKGNLLQEKVLHEKLANALQTNWQGKDAKDGEMAAKALRALPIVRKVIRTLTDIRGSLPTLPDGSTRANQGYALATRGVGAPGAAELLKVAGWIAGAPKAIDPELQQWNDIHAQLSVVTAGVGL